MKGVITSSAMLPHAIKHQMDGKNYAKWKKKN